MTIIVLEDDTEWRAAVARALGLAPGAATCEGHEYLSTEMVPVVERGLNQKNVSVAALVLDLGLDTPWDNLHMKRVLKRLIVEKQPLEPNDMQRFHAYRLALLARDKNVPVALLTNWADYADWAEPDLVWLTPQNLQQAFHADAVFSKGELAKCARWVKEILRRFPL
jgi:hypothetical protein